MRKPRELVVGARYHVSARANRGEMILAPDAMKQLFLRVLFQAKKKYGVRIERFCVMENHFHLILKPKNGTNLSRVMQWVMSVFAMTWNRERGLRGHVWGERFFSKVILGRDSFRAVSDYIHNNPVKAGLVQRAHQWRFSSAALGHDWLARVLLELQLKISASD